MRTSLVWPLLAALLTACSGRSPRADTAHMAKRSIAEVLAAHTDSLMAIPGVVGTAVGLCDDRPCIRVFVADSAAAARVAVGPRLEGYPVRVEVTGPFRARPAPD